jgi:hypothetical protein
VDFRKGMDRLATLVQEQLKADPFSGVIFSFRAKRAIGGLSNGEVAYLGAQPFPGLTRLEPDHSARTGRIDLGLVVR